MKKLLSNTTDFQRQLEQLLDRNTQQKLDVDQTVATILSDVKSTGDQALVEYTAQFDNLNVASADEFEVSQQTLQTALAQVNPSLRQALEFSAKRIDDYHQHQRQRDWSFIDDQGAQLGQRISPIENVGIYVPGGKAAYPSSVLMSAVPAKVAGVKQLIMTVPTPDNQVNRNVLAAAAIAGVDRVFTIGGAQAIAALAFGTKTIPKVDKIVGPGNAYVAAAKRMVFGEVGIDMIAGPSEVLVVSDAAVNPDWIAMDLFAQAEHDEMAQSLHITTDSEHHQAVSDAIERLLPTQPRSTIIQASLDAQGALILAENDNVVVDIINRMAPEHLQLAVENAEELLEDIRHAGAIFVGPHSAEVLGDYCAGPNHVLPTSGTARFSSPLGVYDFQKRSSIIRFNENNVADVAQKAALIAGAEGLMSHKRAAEYRSQSE